MRAFSPRYLIRASGWQSRAVTKFVVFCFPALRTVAANNLLVGVAEDEGERAEVVLADVVALEVDLGAVATLLNAKIFSLVLLEIIEGFYERQGVNPIAVDQGLA